MSFLKSVDLHCSLLNIKPANITAKPTGSSQRLPRIKQPQPIVDSQEFVSFRADNLQARQPPKVYNMFKAKQVTVSNEANTLSVVTMPRLVSRSRADELKFEPLLELRPSTSPARLPEETIIDEKARELWFPFCTRDGMTFEEKHTAKNVTSSIVTSKSVKRQPMKNELQVQVTSLQLNMYVNKCDIVHAPADTQGQAFRGSVPHNFQLPTLNVDNGPVNLVQQKHSVTVESLSDHTKLAINTRLNYAKNLEKNWLKSYREEQRQKLKEKKTMEWLNSRVDLKTDDFSRAFYLNDKDNAELRNDDIIETISAIYFNNKLLGSSNECLVDADETPGTAQQNDNEKLSRYSSMEVLFSDCDPYESDTEIDIQLDDSGLYDVEVKGKVACKLKHDYYRFKDIQSNNDEHDSRLLEEELMSMSDVEIRAMRLKLKQRIHTPEEPMNVVNWKDMAASIMKDIRLLNMKKTKRRKKKSHRSKSEIINWKEKFMSEFGHLLDVQSDHDEEGMPILSRGNTACFLNTVNEDVEHIQNMPVQDNASRRSSLWSIKTNKWKRSRSTSPNKHAKCQFLVFPNRQRSETSSSTHETMSAFSIHADTILTHTEDDLEQYDTLSELEEIEFLKGLAKRRRSLMLRSKPESIVYDKKFWREKTDAEKEAEEEAAARKRKKYSAKSGASKCSAKSAASERLEKETDDDENKNAEDASVYILDSEEVSISTNLPPRPHSATCFKRYEPEISLYDLLEGIEFPAKDVKIAIVYRRRKRQRQRAAEQRAKQQAEDVQIEQVKQFEDKPEAPAMTFSEDAVFVQACLSSKSQARKCFSNEQIDAEINRMSSLFWEMKECRWIRWNKLQQAALERIWERDLVDALPSGLKDHAL